MQHDWWGTESLREKFEGKLQAAKRSTLKKLWHSPCPSLMVRISKTSKTSEASKETTPVSRSKGKASHSISRDTAQLPLRRGYSSEASEFLSDPNSITWFHFCWCLCKICLGTRCNSLLCILQSLTLVYLTNAKAPLPLFYQQFVLYFFPSTRQFETVAHQPSLSQKRRISMGPGGH